MVLKAVLLLLVIAILMDDGTSIKKTPEQEKEDKEILAAVNRTLAEEAEEKEKEKKKKEQEKTQDEKKKKKNLGLVEIETEDGQKGGTKKKEEEDEASSSSNCTCPTVEKCPDIRPCLPCKKYRDCPPLKESGPGPEVQACPPCEECPELECRPCGPCPETPGPVINRTHPFEPCSCPEPSTMTVPAALAVGAVAGLLTMGVATAVGLLLRYASPFVSGFLFLATVIIIWYLSSHYPATARELGGQAATLLREAALALGHRVTEAIQRYRNQVGFSAKPNLFF
jgi:hypothetical protein